MKIGRNDPCSCGSGKKYKACCAVKPARSQIMAMVALVAFAGITGWVIASALMTDSSPPPGKVWSEEHGHYHDLQTNTNVPPGPPPPGPAPAGKIWSEEHGHYHDVQTNTNVGPGPPPPGPAPAGKVWSEEHGHYHDAPTDYSTDTSGSADN